MFVLSCLTLHGAKYGPLQVQRRVAAPSELQLLEKGPLLLLLVGMQVFEHPALGCQSDSQLAVVYQHCEGCPAHLSFLICAAAARHEITGLCKLSKELTGLSIFARHIELAQASE